jgi:SAM-dependent methyltransferase
MGHAYIQAHPMKKIIFDVFYFTGLARIAWHHEDPSTALMAATDAGWLNTGHRVLEVGCGLGTNCEWLAARGFDVTGVDLSSTAIRKARRRLRKKSLNATLYQRDFLDGLEEEPFDVVVDRATLHSFPQGDKRARFSANLAGMVRPGGSLLLIEFLRGKERPGMPPFPIRREDLQELFGPRFQVTKIGEEVQVHVALGELVFGQWRLEKAARSAGASRPLAMSRER